MIGGAARGVAGTCAPIMRLGALRRELILLVFIAQTVAGQLAPPAASPSELERARVAADRARVVWEHMDQAIGSSVRQSCNPSDVRRAVQQAKESLAGYAKASRLVMEIRSNQTRELLDSVSRSIADLTRQLADYKKELSQLETSLAASLKQKENADDDEHRAPAEFLSLLDERIRILRLDIERLRKLIESTDRTLRELLVQKENLEASLASLSEWERTSRVEEDLFRERYDNIEKSWLSLPCAPGANSPSANDRTDPAKKP